MWRQRLIETGSTEEAGQEAALRALRGQIDVLHAALRETRAELQAAQEREKALLEAAASLSDEWPRDHPRSGYPAFYRLLAAQRTEEPSE